MFCAISGKVPKTAVLSPNSKCVFEKSLIEEYVRQNGKDPISKDALDVTQLIEIAQTPQQYALTKAVNSSTLKSNYSIPNLLSTLQDEWDAVMVENFELHEQLDFCKKELSKALYRFDAAMNVATKATSEADHLREEIKVLTENLGNSDLNASEKLENQFEPVSDEFLQELARKSQQFVSKNKKRKFRSTRPPSELKLLCERELSTTGSFGKFTFNSFAGSESGAKFGGLFDTTGDGFILVNEQELKCNLDELTRGEALVSCIVPADENRLLFGLLNGSHGIFNIDTKTIEHIQSSGHDLAVVFIGYLPGVSRDVYVTVHEHGNIFLTDIKNSRSYILESSSFETSLADMHKDGLLALLGNKSDLIIREITKLNSEPVEVLKNQPEDDPIVNARFGSNGYWLFVATAKTLKVIDLRKPAGTLALEEIALDGEIIKFFDTDLSGRTLYLLIEDANGTAFLNVYVYDKTGKKWLSTLNCPVNSAFNVLLIKDLLILEGENGNVLKLLADDKLLTVKA
ncbi:LAMI_0F04984g1_1 [Lachancea mirantina]|uniref:Pre-mRNA-processing factor 19 n=1 Tax=Lachancea mirantina TaxID=1230905 RepID=A0A1G4JY28_9SACH|nr:LAMI_0F04984g1_1 [Lachancea mirantina]